jgi:hypothetical protein
MFNGRVQASDDALLPFWLRFRDPGPRVVGHGSGQVVKQRTYCGISGRMTRRIALVAAIAVAGLTSAAASAPAYASVPSRAAKTCSHSYTRAVIGGEQKCLRRGEYCAVRYARTYVHYGFHCYGSPARLH